MPDDSPDHSMTYAGSGVDYDKLDAFKVACQRAAATTVSLLGKHGVKEADGTRGESAYLLETPTGYLAHVEEGLGTKNLVADAVDDPQAYFNVGIDTVATIVNDLITVGALPISIAMHAAVGDSNWFNDEPRAKALADGFAEGCRRSGAVWGGGETPALAGIVEPNAIVLAGSAVGQMDKAHRVAGDIRAGDRIVFLASTGVQTNGLTLCRQLADRLPDGYASTLGDGRTYGEGLLAPSAIYADFVGKLREADVTPKYLVHVTGHGWRKLMRLDAPFTYRIDTPGEPGALFEFLMDNGPISAEEAWATFNMGVGFAAYVRPDEVEQTVAAAEACGHRAWDAGEVCDGEKAVEVPSLGLRYAAESLNLR
ncbi:MAG: AIR synthase related protein [Planctomycetota bacterium]